MSGGKTPAMTVPQARNILSRLLRDRPPSPEEIAAVVAFVCSPLASAVTGAAWRADGGVVSSIV